MTQTILFDLNQSRQKLEYYNQLKQNLAAQPSLASRRSSRMAPVDKWIEIYEERVTKLERQAKKLGLIPPKSEMN